MSTERSVRNRWGAGDMALRSYVSGSWTSPADEGQPLLDAVTGAEVAKVSTAGIDMNAVLEHGRAVGGPALRELTFQQRAALLKSLGSFLREQRDELYALSARTGATLSDSKFDIDGGIGVLFSYASRGRRELPDDRVLVEGEVEQLGKAGQFVGQHILSPLRGVAVQINAFNFPVWGPLEKLAPAFLAGVPSVVKPASATAYLTHRLVELIVASGLLPEGALQLIAGGVGSLFDHLTDQDLVWFTGSASTATRLRTDPTVVARSVRFNAEADSLNCSVLGPDAQPGTPEFDLFVKQLIIEMTVKAGQKCTAIRRAIVPETLLEAVGEAASERLARVAVGNPSNPSVRMGALASLEQREEVRRSLKGLFAAGEVVFGDPEHVEVVDADPERGAFISPILLRADADRAEPHEVEAFGPGQHTDRLPRHPPRDRPCCPRSWQPRRLGRHVRPRFCPRGRAGCRPLARPAPGARPRRRTGVHWTRVPVADARARWARTRRWRRGVGRYPGDHAPHAAHRSAGQPPGAHGSHEPLGAGSFASHRRPTPLPEVAERAATRRVGRGRPATGHRRRHRTVRRAHRRHVLRAHRCSSRSRQPVL